MPISLMPYSRLVMQDRGIEYKKIMKESRIKNLDIIAEDLCGVQIRQGQKEEIVD